MREILLGRSSLALTATVSMITLAAVALLGLVLAYWSWAWFAPRVEPRAEAIVAPSGSTASARLLFGYAERKAAVAAQTGIAIRLLGTAAASEGRRSHAVVQLEGKEILAVEEGEDIAPGVRLAEVRRDHVILLRGGARERLEWPQRRATPTPTVSPRPATSSNSPTSAGRKIED